MDYTFEDKICLWLLMGLKARNRKYFSLINYYGDLNSLWDNFDKNDSGLSFLSEKNKIALDKIKDMGYVNNCIDKWKNPSFVTIFNNDYPSLLKEISNPPILLFYKGDTNIGDKTVGIVGCRNCSAYGEACAYDLAKDLATEGVTVVSGGARGIDTKAHEGALAVNGKTACVLGCGIDIAYPAENEGLFCKIQNGNGVIFSEFVPETPPEPWNFPQRNRIISGLSKGVAVVEAGEKSGALITACLAGDEGREVFCVPGNINSPISKGTNALIKDGAALIDCSDDIMYACGWGKTKPKEVCIVDNYENLDNTERTIVDIIKQRGEISLDDLCDETGIAVFELNSTMTVLEINGVVKKRLGNIFTI